MTPIATNQPHCLYRFWDHADELLYVGITASPSQRWRQHAGDKPWWSEVNKVTLDPFPTREAVLKAERAAITAERPRYNIVHNLALAPTEPTPGEIMRRVLGAQVSLVIACKYDRMTVRLAAALREVLAAYPGHMPFSVATPDAGGLWVTGMRVANSRELHEDLRALFGPRALVYVTGVESWPAEPINVSEAV